MFSRSTAPGHSGQSVLIVCRKKTCISQDFLLPTLTPMSECGAGGCMAVWLLLFSFMLDLPILLCLLFIYVVLFHTAISVIIPLVAQVGHFFSLFCTEVSLLVHHHRHIYSITPVLMLNCNYFASMAYLLPYLPTLTTFAHPVHRFFYCVIDCMFVYPMWKLCCCF